MVINWDDAQADNNENKRITEKAAQYVRMSTEHQQYSTENQEEAIAKYAKARGYEIVRTYADEGKSGLNIGNRTGLQKLLNDIEQGQSDFEAVLVYDVSRWGRFQDPDEAASYELRCRRAGVAVHYCAEQFENDGSIGSSIIKTVKRAMAGEYSRELSVKVFAGQANLIRHGFRQGGAAGYGLRRMLVDQHGNHKCILSAGEHKSLQTDRIILVPGPAEETITVQKIYDQFLAGRTEKEIATDLNRESIKTDLSRNWTRGTVHQILINEKYIGNNVWGRTSFKLKQEHLQIDNTDWVRCDEAFEAIVDKAVFDQVQQVIAARSHRYSDEEMIEKLKQILNLQGTLSGLIIDEFNNVPSSSCYRTRFGSLIRAYALVGFKPKQDYGYLEDNKRLKRLHPKTVDELIAKMRAHDVHAYIINDTGILLVENELKISLALTRCFKTAAGSLRWKLRFDNRPDCDMTLVARMDETNEEPLDFYLLPKIDMNQALLRLCQYNGLTLDAYRYQSLSEICALFRRVPVSTAA